METSLFWEKYKPRSLKDMIGNEDVKQNFIGKKIDEFINYIFAGPPGTGKSLTVECLMEDVFSKFRIWNMSSRSERGIENVETEIESYCKTGTLDGSERKLAVFQEADSITTVAQKALRVPMEDKAYKVVFILTVNYLGKIIDAIQSRCCVIKFNLASNNELGEFAQRIITGEDIVITEDQLREIIRSSRGQFRKVANTLQGWTTNKRCFFSSKQELDDSIETVFDLMKDTKLDLMMEKIEKLLSSYNSDEILIHLTNTIRNDVEMPLSIKTRSIITCAKCMRDISQGVDTYVAFYSMCSELILELLELKKKNKK